MIALTQEELEFIVCFDYSSRTTAIISITDYIRTLTNEEWIQISRTVTDKLARMSDEVFDQIDFLAVEEDFQWQD